MYLREMGTVELLSREGEIAIAKRIEAGREAMIAGLCESPLTFQAIIIWRDELNEGKVFLRDIIDLEATYAGPDASSVSPPNTGRPACRVSRLWLARHRRRDAVRAEVLAVQPAAPQPAAAFKLAPPDPVAEPWRGRRAGRRGRRPASDFDDDDMENSLSLAAIEAELCRKVLEIRHRCAGTPRRLRRLQDQDIDKSPA